ncbi:MAG: cyclase family protein [Chloroflexota bacterium]|nr:cyclase family protein [Chloroflexota bacterium]
MCAPHVMAMVLESTNRRRLLGGAGLAMAAAAIGSATGRGVARARQATPAASPAATATAVGFGEFTMMQDLTHRYGPGFPVFPGTQEMVINVVTTYEANGYYSNELILNEHTGTHMDAPVHFFVDTATAGSLPLDQLVGPLAVVDISGRAATDADAQVTPDDILAWETAHGPLPAGALVAMYSGWEARLSDPESFVNLDGAGVMHFPGFHPEAAALLVEERDIVGIAVDTLSQDYGASTDFGTHIAILGSGKYGIEAMAALGTVPPTGATVVVGGPKHETASGGPSRIYAFF